jgi:hypothetical protein
LWDRWIFERLPDWVFEKVPVVVASGAKRLIQAFDDGKKPFDCASRGSKDASDDMFHCARNGSVGRFVHLAALPPMVRLAFELEAPQKRRWVERGLAKVRSGLRFPQADFSSISGAKWISQRQMAVAGGPSLVVKRLEFY